MEYKSFVHWVGGKKLLAPTLGPLFPKDKRVYIEPFVGGGGSLFYVMNNIKNFEFQRIIVNDKNEELINAYRVVRENVDELIEDLKFFNDWFNSIEDKEEYKRQYYILRDRYNAISVEDNPFQKAVFFITLTKRCLNGLYRVNKQGKFNNSCGSMKKKGLDEKNLRNVSEGLKNVRIYNKDFTEILKYCNKDTFVYIDPPYYKSEMSYIKKENGFTDRLLEFLEELNNKGTQFLMSNSYEFKDKVADKYRVKEVEALHSFERKTVTEILVMNY